MITGMFEYMIRRVKVSINPSQICGFTAGPEPRVRCYEDNN